MAQRYKERWRRVGLSPDMVEPNFDSWHEPIRPGETDNNAWFRRATAVFVSHLNAIRFFLREDLPNTAAWGAKALECADEYFFGEWRDRIPSGNYGKEPPDRAWQDRNLSWRKEFEACLLWCSAFGEWDRLKRFASFLNEDVILNVEQSKENRNWLLYIANVLQGHPEEDIYLLRGIIVSGRKKRERLLLDFLDAIRNGYDGELHFTSDQYFRRYRATTAKKFEIPAKVDLYGSFLVNYAGEVHDREVPVPERMKDHLVLSSLFGNGQD